MANQKRLGLFTERSMHVSHLIVKTYGEASRAIEDLDILPLSGFIPAHPSLASSTETIAWHMGIETIPPPKGSLPIADLSALNPA